MHKWKITEIHKELFQCEACGLYRIVTSLFYYNNGIEQRLTSLDYPTHGYAYLAKGSKIALYREGVYSYGCHFVHSPCGSY